MLEFVGYFVVGGLVVSLTTYFGSKGQGFLAAFISMFPSLTVLVFFLLYRAGGKESVINYARSLIYVVPPWVLYVVVVWFLCERIGVLWSIILGIAFYLGSSVLVNQLR